MRLPTTRRNLTGLLAGGLVLLLSPKRGASTAASGVITASQFGVLSTNPNNREAFQQFINYLAATGAKGTLAQGVYNIDGGLTPPPKGPVIPSISFFSK